MNLLKNLFAKKDQPIRSYDDFWTWFVQNEKSFFNVVKKHSNIEKGFFNKIAPRLNELKEGFFYLTGMLNESMAELIITADGNIVNMVFVEELVQAAPKLPNWKFTAHKPAMDIADVSINMAGFQFNESNLFFYPNELPQYPDEIDISLVHTDLTEANRPDISNGIYVFLDNFLGELEFATTIDTMSIVKKSDAQKELIPISKLKSYLIWRQKEFVEKYHGVRHDTEEDSYSSLEAELENGNPLIALINSDLLAWDGKASHPWILNLEMKYKNGINGMPDEETYQLLNEIEESLMLHLKDSDGYLNVGRETADNVRNVYFACREFRKPSKVLHETLGVYQKRLDINYDIFKDKYWQTFNRFLL